MSDRDALIAAILEHPDQNTQRLVFAAEVEVLRQLKKSLRAEIDEGEWSKLNSATSQAFDPPRTGTIAVKVINHFGDEALKVYPVPSLDKGK